nr:hypothetical protein [Tanacetum cinerariifolium]
TPPPHPTYRTTARISIPAPVPMPAWTESEVARLLSVSSPPASPLSPWFSPPPQIPFPPLPPILLPPSPILASLGYRAPMNRLRDEAASTSHSPPSQLLSASRREDRPDVTLPPQKRLDIALGPRYEVGESSSAAAARPAGGFRADYGFVATVDREIMRDPEREVGYGITDSWDEIAEARMSREAWTRATNASDLVHGEVISLRTTVLGQISEIRELQAADRRRQTGQIAALQGQVTALQAQVATLQGHQGLARDSTHPEPPEEAGGSA